MSAIPEHTRGFRDGARAAVTWLHERAREMNDPKAVLILNSAATNLGWDLSSNRLFAPDEPTPPTATTDEGRPA